MDFSFGVYRIVLDILFSELKVRLPRISSKFYSNRESAAALGLLRVEATFRGLQVYWERLTFEASGRQELQAINITRKLLRHCRTEYEVAKVLLTELGTHSPGRL